MSVLQVHETLEKSIKNLQSNFTQLLTSNCHYNTSEITDYIKHINNALDNIKLDYEFRNGSKSWAKQFDVNEIKSNETNIKQLIIEGNNLIQQLNTRLHINEMNNKELNQIREIHSWACNSLNDYLQALHPYASDSYARLDNIAHHLGVTDRFVGYRNNLTRYGSQPVNLHTIWADRKLPPESTPNWKDWTHAFEHPGPSINIASPRPSNDNRNVFSSMGSVKPIETPPPTKIERRSFTYRNDSNSPMNSARNTKYPGASETIDRYRKPKLPSYSSSFSVAQPDYTIVGRPLARLVSKSSFSEYTDRYTVPDATKIERYPWLRPLN